MCVWGGGGHKHTIAPNQKKGGGTCHPCPPPNPPRPTPVTIYSSLNPKYSVNRINLTTPIRSYGILKSLYGDKRYLVEQCGVMRNTCAPFEHKRMPSVASEVYRLPKKQLLLLTSDSERPMQLGGYSAMKTSG